MSKYLSISDWATDRRRTSISDPAVGRTKPLRGALTGGLKGVLGTTQKNVEVRLNPGGGMKIEMSSHNAFTYLV